MDALNWILANWSPLTNVAMALVLAVIVIKNGQWDRLLVIAAEVTDDVSMITGMDNQEKRKFAADSLWAAAGPVAQRLFTREQMEQIVEIAWHTIIKPAQKADDHGPV